jgi:hypothetical protein
MSRPLHKLLPEKTSPNGSGGPVMVYMCECGMKWTGATSPTWTCECGRHLVKTSGAIYSAIVQTSDQMASAPRILRKAAG